MKPSLLIIMILTFLNSNAWGSDNYKYPGPFLELQCSLTKMGKSKFGSSSELGKGKLVLKVHTEASKVAISTTPLQDKVYLKELVTKLGENCKGDFSGLEDFLGKKLEEMISKKVHKMFIREYDSILFDFLKTANNENCSKKYAENIQSKWILSYAVKDPRC
jgi:hypothetical protein